MAKKPKRYAAHVELNMVPMIDVVFQLLIFLMVMPSSEMDVLPMNLPKGLGPLPRAMLANPQRELRIDLLHVEPYGDQTKSETIIRLNGEQVPDNAVLRRRLKEAQTALLNSGMKLDKLPVLISPDMGVWHKHVVAAFDAVVDAGFKNIQFTVPK